MASKKTTIPSSALDSHPSVCDISNCDTRIHLIGDSIFRRLYEGHTAIFHPLSANTCLSGKGTAEIKKAVKNSAVGFNVALLVGVNDITKKRPPQEIRTAYKSLFSHLRRRCTKVFLVLILPIGTSHLLYLNEEVRAMNDFISSFADVPGVRVVDLYSKFNEDGSIKYDLFQPFIKRREDNIHPNLRGLRMIRDVLLTSLNS